MTKVAPTLPTVRLPGAAHRVSDVLARRLAWLAPIFVPSRGPGLSRRRFAGGVAAFICLVVISLVRTPHVFDIVYIEDGQRFLADALVESPLVNVLHPYSGYFQVIPRLLGELAAVFPVSWAATVLALEAASANALLAILVYIASGGLLRRPILRLLVSVPLVMTPTAHLDVPNSITQLRWSVMYALFWLLLWVPRTRVGEVVNIVLTVLIAFSDNVVGIFAPLAFARLILRRDRTALVASVALVVAELGNALLVVTGASRHPTIHPRPNPVWAAAEWFLRPVPEAFVGERSAAWPRPHTLLGVAPLLLGWLVLAAVIVVAARRFTSPNWLLFGVAVTYSFALYTFVLMVSGFADTRYTVPPTLFLLVGCAALLQPRTDLPPARRSTAVVPIAALSVIVLIACLANLRMDDNRSQGPRWSAEIAKARTTCDTTKADTVNVAISPAQINPGWVATLPCSYVG
jgi:hypothetical protein